MMSPRGSLLLLTCGLLLLSKHATVDATIAELTDANFFDYAKDKDVLLVDFYAPWCPDCKALDPDFAGAARSLGSRSIDLARVDCFGAGKGLCSTYGVKQWPTLKNFNRGQYTGDYTGGLTTPEIAGYITTVENSVHPVVNPYASTYTPQASPVVTQQCVAKCKISRLANKQPCYARCKPKSGVGKKPALPQPVINEKSCAKCRQPQIAGKFRRHCSLRVRKACRRHRLHKAHRKSHRTSSSSDSTSKKATIGTLTAATNDNVVKLSLSEPLIVPPNAEHRHRPREEELFIRESKSSPHRAERKTTRFNNNIDGNSDDSEKKTELSEHEQMMRLINDADDKKKPVLSMSAPPQPHDKYVQIPPHDAGDKKMGMQHATKLEKQVKYPLPKVPAKALKFSEPKLKIAPKFLNIKVPPHDSGDFQGPPKAANVAAVVPKMAHKQGFVGMNKNLAQRMAFAKRLKSQNILPANIAALRANQTAAKLRQAAQLTKALQHPNAGAALLPMVHPIKPAAKKGLVKVTPKLLNGTGLILSSPLPMKEHVPMENKIVALNRVGPLTSQGKKTRNNDSERGVESAL